MPVTLDSNGVDKLVSVLVSVADSYATKPLPLKRFRMEAEVGIGRFMPYFQRKKYDISPMNASNFALLLHYPDEPLPTYLLKVLLKIFRGRPPFTI